MKVMLLYGGNTIKTKRNDEDYPILYEMLDRTVIDLQRVPCKGEFMSFIMGDYCVNAKVINVFTNYNQPGNPHVRRECYGDYYAVQLDDAEIIETYESNTEK